MTSLNFIFPIGMRVLTCYGEGHIIKRARFALPRHDEVTNNYLVQPVFCYGEGHPRTVTNAAHWYQEESLRVGPDEGGRHE